MNEKERFVVEKMRIFESCLVDVQSNVLSTIPTQTKGKSVWNVKGPASHDSSGSQKSELKVPPPGKHYYKREDQRQQLFEMVGQLTEQFNDVSKQTEQMLKKSVTESTTPVAQSVPIVDDARISYLKLIETHFKNLKFEERQQCLEEMLLALGQN